MVYVCVFILNGQPFQGMFLPFVQRLPAWLVSLNGSDHGNQQEHHSKHVFRYAWNGEAWL